MCCINRSIWNSRSQKHFVRLLSVVVRSSERSRRKTSLRACRIGPSPTMAATDAERMPPLDKIEGWLVDAGFIITERRRVIHNKELDLADQEAKFLVEARGRYSFISEQEVATGLRSMRAEAKAQSGSWTDPRPTSFIVALKTPSPPNS